MITARVWTATAVGALACTFAFGGCSDDPAPDVEPTGGMSNEPAPTASAPTPTESALSEPAPTDEEPTGDDQLDNPEGAIAELTDLACAPDDDSVWNATATITNSGPEPAEYRFKVAITEAETSRVLGEKETLIVVESGESMSVELEGVYDGDDGDLRCVPRLVRGDA